MEYIELNGGACDDCVQAIANDDYTGMSDETAAHVRSGIDYVCGKAGACLVIGEERGFDWRSCTVCGALAGNRHQVGYLTEVSA